MNMHTCLIPKLTFLTNGLWGLVVKLATFSY